MSPENQGVFQLLKGVTLHLFMSLVHSFCLLQLCPPFVGLLRICHRLARQGRKVYFTICDSIVQQLLRAKRDLELDKLLKKLSRFDVMMIDDFGYVKQDRDEMEVLFTLLAHRYERGSMLITSNLPFSKWEMIFKDPMTTAAAIDRLVHHSVVLELNAPSYRAEQAMKRKNKNK